MNLGCTVSAVKHRVGRIRERLNAASDANEGRATKKFKPAVKEEELDDLEDETLTPLKVTPAASKNNTPTTKRKRSPYAGKQDPNAHK